MTEQTQDDAAHICEACGKPTTQKVVSVTMWSGAGLVVVENVPVQVCEGCEEQYYGEDTGERILQLASAGFPREKMLREITVPVFALPDPIKPQSGDQDTQETEWQSS